MQKFQPHYVERPPDPPEIKWALDLLEPDLRTRGSILQEFYHYIIFPAMGASYHMVKNKMNRVPLTTNPVLLGGRVALGLVVGHLVGIRQAYVTAERDARMRDYIRAHPEHFPDPNIRKWGDIFAPWAPIR